MAVNSEPHLRPEFNAEPTFDHAEPTDQYTGAIFAKGQHFVVSGGNFKSVVNIHRAAPPYQPPEKSLFLKIRCDGQKPICGPCRKHPKDDECKYSGPARSRTKALEDTVQRLEARLRELERSEDYTPSVLAYPQLSSISPSYPSSSKPLPDTPDNRLPRLLPPSRAYPESQAYSPLSPFLPPSTTAAAFTLRADQKICDALPPNWSSPSRRVERHQHK
ncbi:hypothetical protein B0H19DRAFT_1365272 [Mycena capillaripes]|nr:hypothetical protein B0H19DRAFT_1365272 [Mycena capillaripes]